MTDDATGSGGTGIAIPVELSAVPPVGSPARQESEGTYDTALQLRYVHEPALSRFELVEQLLQALAQTHYAENVGAPYKAVVVRDEPRGNVTVKKQQPWTIESKIVTEGGRTFNRVSAWIEVIAANGQPIVQFAQFDIFAPPTFAADGSYATYGEWKIISLSGSITSFAAECAPGANGESVVKAWVGANTPFEVKAIITKAQAAGFGKITYKERNMVGAEVQNNVLYAYDGEQLALQTNNGAIVYKERSSPARLVLHYGVFDKETGQSLREQRTFGFPFTYAGGRGYYSNWQGRHQVWVEEGTIAPGTQVQRADRDEKYTVATPLDGILTKRVLVPGMVGDVTGVPLARNDFSSRNLLRTGGLWFECTDQTCTTAPTQYDNLDSYTFDVSQYAAPNGPVMPKRYTIRLYNPAETPVYVVWKDHEFYELLSDGPMPMLGPTPLTPAEGAVLELNTFGQTYVVYDGSSWTEKMVTGADMFSGEPLFDPDGDRPYTLVDGETFYAPTQSGGYLVTKTASGYDVNVEREVVATPINAAGFVPADTILHEADGKPNPSTYTYQMNASAGGFMKLLYATVGTDDAANGGIAGHEVTHSVFGLTAWVNGVGTNQRFNWEYPETAQSPARLSYLLNADSSTRYLDDAMTFDPITAQAANGAPRTVILTYDGQLHGVPGYFNPDTPLTPALAANVVVLPTGTEVTNGAGTWRLKALELVEILRTAATPRALDVSQGASLDLSTVPKLTMLRPADRPVVDGPPKYSEGQPVPQ